MLCDGTTGSILPSWLLGTWAEGEKRSAVRRRYVLVFSQPESASDHTVADRKKHAIDIDWIAGEPIFASG